MQAYVPELKGSNFELSEPELYPDVGIWHPLAPAMYEDLKEYLNWCAFETRTLGFFEFSTTDILLMKLQRTAQAHIGIGFMVHWWLSAKYY